MTLTIDKRAGSIDLYKPLKARLGRIVKKGTLDSADAAWEMVTGEKWGVEVKHLADVLQCIADGRFVSQLRRMQKQYGVYYLLIVDDFKGKEDGSLIYKKVFGKFASSWFQPFASRRGNAITYDGLQNWISTMVHKGGCYYDHVQDNGQAVKWLVTKYQWGLKRKHDSLNVFGTLKPAPRRSKTGVRFIGKPNKIACVVNVLVDGIGWEKAKAISYHFDSPDAFWHATEKELAEVKGVGKVLAQRIVEERKRMVKGKSK